MKTNLRNVMERAELSAAITVIAILLAGGLTKLGYGWGAIAVIVALFLLGSLRKPNLGSPGSRDVHQPALG